MVESITHPKSESNTQSALSSEKQPSVVSTPEGDSSTVAIVRETLQTHFDVCDRHGMFAHKKLPSLTAELEKLEEKQKFIHGAWCRQAYLYLQQEEARQTLTQSLLECEMIDKAIKTNQKDIRRIKKRIRKVAKKLPKQTQHKSNLPNILLAVSEKE